MIIGYRITSVDGGLTIAHVIEPNGTLVQAADKARTAQNERSDKSKMTTLQASAKDTALTRDRIPFFANEILGPGGQEDNLGTGGGGAAGGLTILLGPVVVYVRGPGSPSEASKDEGVSPRGTAMKTKRREPVKTARKRKATKPKKAQ